MHQLRQAGLQAEHVAQTQAQAASHATAHVMAQQQEIMQLKAQLSALATAPAPGMSRERDLHHSFSAPKKFSGDTKGSEEAAVVWLNTVEQYATFQGWFNDPRFGVGEFVSYYLEGSAQH